LEVFPANGQGFKWKNRKRDYSPSHHLEGKNWQWLSTILMAYVVFPRSLCWIHRSRRCIHRK
jgi:hypothetical protein